MTMAAPPVSCSIGSTQPKLLKAILVQRGVPVFDPNKRTSIGFEKCVNLATQYAKLTQEEAGLLWAVDALRDAEQHWLIIVPEDVLYLHARGFVTTFAGSDP
jgi:hypothetical protein